MMFDFKVNGIVSVAFALCIWLNFQSLTTHVFSTNITSKHWATKVAWSEIHSLVGTK